MVRLKQGAEWTPQLPCAHFNPTMVRLKPHGLILLVSTPLYFNPTMVRLKHTILADAFVQRLIFQSHNGSIKT